MKHWLITAGYVTADRLGAESWRGPYWRKAADIWCSFFYRRYCPYPTVKDDWSVRACIEAGRCGCSNALPGDVGGGK